jgi:MFS transporter, DHA1 family, inner membrane transport protein
VTATARTRSGGGPPPAAVLFLCMFAAQGALIVLSPILPAVAADFDVSTAVGAQLRSLSGLVAGGVALWFGVRSRPRPLRQVLIVGTAILAASTAASAAAPSFAVLAVSQVGVGVALALLLSGALAAAGEWAPERTAKTLSWALVGQPVAWIVGLPLVGAAAEVSWRLGWLVLPCAASLVALGALALRPPDAVPRAPADEPSLWRQPGTKGWAAGELLAYGGWAGTLVFAGALFIESYGISTAVVGLLLALVAAAYLPGNFLARRWVEQRARGLLIGGALVSAVGVALFGVLRPAPAWSLAVLTLLAFVAGARTIAGSSLGLTLAPHCRLQAMSTRTGAVQFGYLIGAGLGGAALAAAGYAGLGWTLGALYLAAAIPHIARVRDRRGVRTTAPAVEHGASAGTS